MASIYRHSSRNGWCVQVVLKTNLRVVLWLGDVAKSGATEIARHVQRLANADAANTTAHADSMRWARGTDKRIKAKLIDWGLIPESHSQNYTITTWVDKYCEDRTDVAERTRNKYKNCRRRLLEIVPDKDIRAVTVADAKRFARMLSGRDSAQGSIVKVIKQIFAEAVSARLLECNPFADLAASTAIDPARSAYITPTDAAAILAKIASQECRLAFLLARWAGFRVPSEVLTLKWTDIDWEANRITIHSPKGERYQHRKTRLIPLFPKLQQPLLEASESAAERSTYVIDRYRTSANRVFRAQLLTAIVAAKLQPWPKLWMNLRASCRTDLEDSLPAYVCDEWLGHSNEIAAKHYKRVTPDHFEAALGAVTGAVVKWK